MHELRVAVRVLRRSPAFTLIAILLIALGVGLNTALFSVLHAALWKPLLYRGAEGLVLVGSVENGRSFAPLTPANFDDVRREATSFDGATGYRYHELELGAVDTPERITALHVVDGFFSFLAVPPLLGRTLLPGDFTTAPSVEDGLWSIGQAAVLDHDFWKSGFGGDEHVVGRVVRLNDQSVRIVGVMPPGFDALWGETDVYVPWILPPDFWSVRPPHVLPMLARLRPGVSIETAAAEVETIYARLAREYPQTNAVLSGRVDPVRSHLFGETGRSVSILFVGALLVLLAACANLAGLLAIRARSRVKEVAVRRALGAGMGRVGRQLLAESALLATAGGILGWVGAAAALRFFEPPGGLPFPPEPGAAVLGFSGLLLAATALSLGLVPAWLAARSEIATTLRGASHGATGSRLSGAFVVLQVGAAFALSCTAGLLLRSVVSLSERELGFEARAVASFYVTLPDTRYADVESQRQFRRRALEELSGLPGVVSAGSASHVPFTPMALDLATAVEGRPLPRGTLRAAPVFVSRDTLALLRISLLSGRPFGASDSKDSPWVIIVNERMAASFWPGESALGRRIFLEYPWIEAPLTVIGVAADVAQERAAEAARPAFYILHEQFPQEWMYFVLRIDSSDPASVVAAARARLAEIDPSLPVTDVATMEERVARALSEWRSRAELASLYAVSGLVLSVLGLYASLAGSVAQRTKELAIRMALGASRPQVVRLASLDGLALLGAGIVLGLALALAGGRLVSSLLVDVAATDPPTLVGALAVMLVLGCAAIGLPAGRAARLHLATRLRQE